MTGTPILVIDDNPTNLKLTRLVLSGDGFEVRTALDATEAMAVLAEFRPRAILMDLQLPGVDGYELTRRLKASATHRHIVILALTAYAMKGDKEKALAAGCDGYITKPIDTRTLASTIVEHLANPPTASP